MPPKNYTPIDPGQTYFNTSGELIQEVKITEEPPELDICGNTPKYIVPQTSDFTADVLLTPGGQRLLANLVQVIRSVWDGVARVMALWQSYPNKRVKHLALYAKRPRTRKKNMRRIGRELLKEVERRDT